MQQTIREVKLSYRTKSRGESTPLDTSRKAVAYLKGAFDDFIEQEQMYVILLNRKNYPMGRIRIGIGTSMSVLAHPKEVFRAAIVGGATAIILAHNHPSGVPIPSRDDIGLTGQIRKASQVVKIDFLDHLIICPMGDDEEDLYFSFSENDWTPGVSVPVSKPRTEGRCHFEVLPGGAR